MLPPLALAACAGLRGPKARLVVPMSLSQGGNAIVASNQAAASLTDGGSPPRLRLLDWLRAQAFGRVLPSFMLSPRIICCCATGSRPVAWIRIGTSKRW